MRYVAEMEFIYQLIEWAVEAVLYSIVGLATFGVIMKIFPRLND